MRMRCLILLVFVGWVHPALGGIRPSFMPEYSSWHASDIVIVTATATDGKFEVSEVWKGDLHPGDRVEVPELRPATNAVPIGQYPDESYPREGSVRTQIPRQFPGMRLVLFLRGVASSDDRATAWQSSNPFSDMKASVVWIEGDQVLGFIQTMNPGPSSLQPLGRSLTKLTARVSEVIRIQRELREITATKNGAERAKALEPYLLSDIFPARNAAEEELGRSGPTAVPVISAILEDEAFAAEWGALVRALVSSGGASVGGELTARLERDLEFWRGVGPGLKKGWWNDDITPKSPLRNRYNQTLELLRGLRVIRFAEGMDTVTTLRDYWRSLPQLDDPSGLNQLSEECDKLISALRQENLRH